MTAVAIPAALAFLLALALTPLARRLALLVGATDLPDARRVHVRATPRLGGLAVAVAMVAACALGGVTPLGLSRYVLAGGALLLAAGIADDIWSLQAHTKLLAQVIAAVLAVVGGLRFSFIAWASGGAITGPEAAVLNEALTVLWIVFITNAFNLSDGLDGLAAGIGVIGLGWLAATALRMGDPGAATGPLVLAGALLGFLVYNFNPASIFLGDGGSLVIGYALAVLPLAGQHGEIMGPLGAFLLAALPATDTLLAVARRFLSRWLGALGDGRLWRGVAEGLREMVRPDRRHIHHRLLDLGFSQRRAVLLLYLAAVTTGGLGYAVAGSPVWPVDVFALGLALTVVGLVQALGIDELRPARTGLILPVLHRIARHRSLIVTADLCLMAAAYAASLLLSGQAIGSVPLLGAKLLVVTAVQLAVFRLLGVYRTVWWASGASDFALLLRACGAGTVGGYLALRLLGLPATATMAIIRFLFLLPSMTAMRFSHVLLASAARGASRRKRALICGTAAEARHVLAHMRRNGLRSVEPIGFIEFHPHLQGRQLGRLPVLGTLDALAAIVREQRVDHLVIADPALHGEGLRWARAVCRQLGVDVHRYVEKLVPDDATAAARSRRLALEDAGLVSNGGAASAPASNGRTAGAHANNGNGTAHADGNGASHAGYGNGTNGNGSPDAARNGASHAGHGNGSKGSAGNGRAIPGHAGNAAPTRGNGAPAHGNGAASHGNGSPTHDNGTARSGNGAPSHGNGTATSGNGAASHENGTAGTGNGAVSTADGKAAEHALPAGRTNGRTE
jgi:UDP-GlcNAc:undecaprenyl-phosphate GlcNAc-1-phosphate transferase